MKRKTLLAAVLAGVLSAAVPAGAADYVIDKKDQHASITFRIKHLGYSWLVGRFDNFEGTFSYDEAKPEDSKVKVDIDVTSINSNHGERDKHLRGPEFLNVAEFPKASFESSSVKPTGDGKADIVGNLTLMGVTKEIVIKAEHVGGGDDPWGGIRQGFTGTAKLSLPDFPFKRLLGPASRELDLILDVEGVRPK